MDLELEPRGDGAWPDLEELKAQGKLVWTEQPMRVVGLPGGMTSGKPSVAFRFDLPDGRTLVAETSLALLLTAVRALVVRHGDPTKS
jgi:hypothetical protein